MNFGMIRYVLGWVMLCESALLLLPGAVSLYYGESALWALLGTVLLCALLGGAMILYRPKNRVMYQREGFVITALAWIMISLMGSLPFLFTGVIKSPVDALFETVSGFTTTGASVLADVEVLPRGLLFWRSFTQWIGGMGVLVFLLTVLPMTGGRQGGSHVNLMKAESPGPQVEKLVPKVQSTAMILYGIYIVMTLVQIGLLLLGDMPVFDAVTTAFGTAGTGGFGIKNDSMASYSPYIQWVKTVFMILFGINFNFYFLMLLFRFRKAFRMEEVRWYLAIILLAVSTITMDISDRYATAGAALRAAAFQVGSVITSTGFATADFNLWPGFSKTVLVTLMFIGACAGSTGGGIKVSRILILHKTFRKERRLHLHPQRVTVTAIDEKVVPPAVVRSTNVFMVAYVLIFFWSLLLISLNEFDFTTNFTAVVATLNNIGPGLAGVGPTQNFAGFSIFSKLVLIFDMLAGRLELFPLLMLFSSETWKKF